MNKKGFNKWGKNTEKYFKQYFPHVDLGSPKKLYEFINRIIPFIKMKKDGKIKTLKDGSGTFLKKDLEKYKNE